MRKPWTKEEEQWLTQNYTYAGLAETCRVLGRGESSVLHKVSDMKLARKGNARKPRILDKGGYLWVSYEGGQEAVHRMVMEFVLKRPLSPDESVHHKDGNTYNNNPDNLEVMSISEHLKEHYKDREIDALGRLK